MMDCMEEDDYDATAILFSRGDFLRKLREMEREDQAKRDADRGDPTESSVPQDTLRYEIFLKDQRYHDDLKHINYKFVDFGEINGKQLVVEQDRSLGKGGLIWDAGFILGEHVIRESYWRSASKTCSIVELGAGTGITGLMVASAFPEVHVEVTDLPQLMPLLEKNCANTPNTSASVLEWGGNVKGSYDVILGADVVASIYDSYGLAKTIYELAHSNSLVYLACRDRLAGSIEEFEGHLQGMFLHVERRKADSSNKNQDVWILIARGKCSNQ
jgi:predicted nicotinamide N-methyase